MEQSNNESKKPYVPNHSLTFTEKLNDVYREFYLNLVKFLRTNDKDKDKQLIDPSLQRTINSSLPEIKSKVLKSTTVNSSENFETGIAKIPKTKEGMGGERVYIPEHLDPLKQTRQEESLQTLLLFPKHPKHKPLLAKIAKKKLKLTLWKNKTIF